MSRVVRLSEGSKIWRGLALLVCLSLFSAACSAGDDDAGMSGDGEASVLVTGWTDIGTLDWSPVGSGNETEKVMGLVSDSLTTLNPDTLEIEGSLAESYEVSDDGRTWTFKLRPDVPFHDDWGTVTAEDVKYTWGEWMSPESAHGRSAVYQQAVGGDIDNFEIVSDLEFRLHTTDPVSHLPFLLCACQNGLFVASKAYHDQEGIEAEQQHPIGTGPWAFVSSSESEVQLEAFEDHWQQAPAFDRLVLELIPDSAARLTQVQSGEVDLAVLDSTLAGEAEAAGLQVLAVPDVANVFMVLGGAYFGNENLDSDSPWIQGDDPEKGLAIREALSLAIDRQLILDTVLSGYGDLTYGPILQFPSVPGLTDPSWELPPYDPDLAHQKLAEGGYPDGFTITIFQYPEDIDTVSIGEAIAGMWEEIGVTVERQPADESILREQQDAMDTDGLAWVKLAGFATEPAVPLAQYSIIKGRAYNLLYPAIEDGLDRAAAEFDPERRAEIAREVISALRDDMVAIPLFTADMLFVAGPRVGGWSPFPGLNAYSRLETVEAGG